ncbi:hypothetical protein [Paenibacillus wulumuqiensis]|uniref:hypothetical protein n=1 Tax=Paenibacillus wulumuqiensis TaxID=1567107 RepID=UPI0006196687|nr:hypothetical protein [Paenibacillus wulumuqiensis]
MRVKGWLKSMSFILLLPLFFSVMLPFGAASVKASISPQTEPPPEDLHHNWVEYLNLRGGGQDTSAQWSTNNQADVSFSFVMQGQGELTVSYEVYGYYKQWVPMHSVTFTKSGKYDYKMGYYPRFPEDVSDYRVTYRLKETDGPVRVYGNTTFDYYDRWIPTGGGW